MGASFRRRWLGAQGGEQVALHGGIDVEAFLGFLAKELALEPLELFFDRVVFLTQARQIATQACVLALQFCDPDSCRQGGIPY